MKQTQIWLTILVLFYFTLLHFTLLYFTLTRIKHLINSFLNYLINFWLISFFFVFFFLSLDLLLDDNSHLISIFLLVSRAQIPITHNIRHNKLIFKMTNKKWADLQPLTWLEYNISCYHWVPVSALSLSGLRCNLELIRETTRWAPSHKVSRHLM